MPIAHFTGESRGLVGFLKRITNAAGATIGTVIPAFTPVREDGSVIDPSGGGPQPAASSQSVTPASDGAAFPIAGRAGAARPATVADGTRKDVRVGASGEVYSILSTADGNALTAANYEGAIGQGANLSVLLTRSIGDVFNPTEGHVLMPGGTSGVYIISKGGGGIATAQISVGTTATLVAAARAGRQKITFTSTTAVAFYYGAAGVTTTTGAFVAAAAGASITLDFAGALYVVGASVFTGTVTELF